MRGGSSAAATIKGAVLARGAPPVASLPAPRTGHRLADGEAGRSNDPMPRRNWFARNAQVAAGASGAAAVLLVAAAQLLGGFEWLEHKALDLRFRYANSLTPRDDIVCIDIDDESLNRIGRWPWPRDVQAPLFTIPDECGAAALLVDIEYNEPETVSLTRVADLDLLANPADLFADPSDLRLPDEALRRAIAGTMPVYLATRFVEARGGGSADRAASLPAAQAEASAESASPPASAPALTAEQLEARLRGDLRAAPLPDDHMAQAVRALFDRHYPALSFDNETPQREQFLFVLRQELGRAATLSTELLPPELARPVAVPVEWVAPVYFRFARVARRCGFVTFEADDDGIVRRNALIALTTDRETLPQIALAAAWDQLRRQGAEVERQAGRLRITRGRAAGGAPLDIQLDERRRTLVPWVGGGVWQEQFAHISAAALMDVHQARDRIRQNDLLLDRTRAELFSSNFFASAESYARHAEALQEAQRQERVRHYAGATRGPAPPDQRVVELRARLRAHEDTELAALERERDDLRLRSAADAAVASRLSEIELILGPLRRLETGIAAANAAAQAQIDARMRELRARLKGKFCLLGYTATALADMVPTPTEKRVPGVMAHACLLNGLLDGRMVTWAPRSLNVALTLLLGGLLTALSAAVRPRTGVLLLLGALVGYSALAIGLFYWATYWLAWTPTLAALIGGYLAVEGYRYVFLDRERRQLTKALSQYTSATLARQMAENAELCKKAEMRQVSAMFTDLMAFTSISEEIGAERTQAVLNICLGRFSQIMLTHEAMINKFIGDGVFAFWNPVIYPQADHARRACETAIDLQRGLQRLIAEQEHGGDPVLQRFVLRIGVATGNAVVGPCGSEQKYDYTCIGDSVNVASRLEAANKFFGTLVLVSGATREQAGPGFEFRPLGGVRVKGKQTAVPIFELLGRCGEVPEELLRFAALFGSAVQAFQRQYWNVAAEQFRECARMRPDDLATSQYLQAVERLRAAPPAADWNGAIELLEK